MPRVRVLAAAAAVLLGTAVAPARAATPPGRIVVSGNGTRYVDVTFRTPVALHLEGTSRVTAAFTGDYAGLAVETGDAAHELVGGAVLVRGRFDSRSPERYLFRLRQVTYLSLAPGRYRLVLLSDGNAEVSVSAEGVAGTRRYVARGSVRGVAASRTDVTVPVEVDPGAGIAAVPVTQPRRGILLVGLATTSHVAPGWGVHVQRFCVSRDDLETSCVTGTPNPTVDGVSVVQTIFDPQRLPHGDYTASATAFGADPAGAGARVLFTLSLPTG
ncbi:MAG TPA: hypothetical protein VFQ85_16860 [Mycobacteriales bacterium]|nr:hypothetical protein [Mycobacteriales bacterium]